MKLEYPLNDALPNIDHARDRLLARLFSYRQLGTAAQQQTKDEDYSLLYAYGESPFAARWIMHRLTECSIGDWSITR